MFSNLSKGSILYGLNTKGDIKLFTAPIENVTIPYPKQITNTFGQLPEMAVDIVATVNGERREFKQVPSNSAIADFGPDAFILADNKESLNSYISSMLQNSRNIVNSIDKHKVLIVQYEAALAELNPQYRTPAQDDAIKDMQKQIAELAALIKNGNISKKE